MPSKPLPHQASEGGSVQRQRFAYGGIFILIVLLLAYASRTTSKVELPYAPLELVARALARGEPTIESRVEKILSETPLFGTLSYK